MDCCSQLGLQPFQKMRQHILDTVEAPVPSENHIETLSIELAQGRVLARAVSSNISVPPFHNSAMDGYAIAYADQVAGAKLLQSQTIFAGDNPAPLMPGTCVRIMTGAPMPEGADTVVMQENVQRFESTEEIWIAFPYDLQQGSNVRKLGSDVNQGEKVLDAGCRLQSAHIAQLAVLGIAQVEVYKQLTVAVFSTGDELVVPGEALKPGQIYDSNRIAVVSVLQNLGVNILDLGILPDEPALLRTTMLKAADQSDVIVSSGGVSVGEADYTKAILDELGKVEFWKLAIKPGKPFAYGKIGTTDFMGLPGNPVSALVTFYQLVVPALLIRMGSDWQPPVQFKARLEGTQLKKKPGRMDFQRGVFTVAGNGDIVVTSSGYQCSAMFTSMVNSNCFIVLERERADVEAGEWVTVEPFSWPM